jgi:hypothetical protein
MDKPAARVLHFFGKPARRASAYDRSLFDPFFELVEA